MPYEVMMPRYLKMRNLCTKALELDPSFSLALNGLGSIYIQMNYMIEGSHNYLDSALYYLLKAIKVDPEFGELYVTLGDLYRVKGMYSMALEQVV
jgi:tetratricopeptide (TPR) repeat protein